MLQRAYDSSHDHARSHLSEPNLISSTFVFLLSISGLYFDLSFTFLYLVLENVFVNKLCKKGLQSENFLEIYVMYISKNFSKAKYFLYDVIINCYEIKMFNVQNVLCVKVIISKCNGIKVIIKLKCLCDVQVAMP